MNKLDKQLKDKASFIDPRRGSKAATFYLTLLQRLGFNDAEREHLLAICQNNVNRVATYLRAFDALLLTSENLKQAVRGTGKLPCAIFLNEQIRELDPEFTTLNR